MTVPPLYLCDRIDSYISGEVKIHPSAVVAPGVIFQAAANSRIVISQGVCIGMGAILQVDRGTLLVEAGVSIGAGFLMIGSGTIGANSCIGSATTVFNSSVAPKQVVPPGSIIGDQSRVISESHSQPALPSSEPKPEPELQLEDDLWAESPKNQQPEIKPEIKPEANKDNLTAVSNSEEELAVPPQTEPPSETPNNFGANIYGQSSVQRLLVTLFPHRQSLNKPLSDDE
ncbi:carbon dioxide concentrating mechanism protein [Calothrix sp. PCC 6303]|uniref:carbon dioxide concentrating mechanism protein n=1 Tax=Calothrix sp. PCC 6303 TaxID=1170562 RepID=UPI0002A00CF0|nr:carbon dioxide concentrating mechanism protein [Calothrix sp. PCC 6303]AFY99762.1 carbon dioxide concentrating mechanism protein [Calothrix sp. PCC 6303]